MRITKFLHSSLGVMCLAVLAATTHPVPILAEVATPPADAGEPYAITGNKLIFASWRFIRPGRFSWVNEAGKNVSVRGDEDAWGATMQKRDHPFGIRLVAQPAERRGPLIKSERPWEAQGVSLETVLRDGKRFRAWGRCNDAKGKEHHCYFESEDGVNWQRPEFDFVEFDGERKNNLLPFSPGTVFLDPSAPADERYKGVGVQPIDQQAFEEFRRKRPDAWSPQAIRKDAGFVLAIIGAVSADGLRWKKLPEPLVVEHSDTQVVAYYDQVSRKYVMFTRHYNVRPRAMSLKEKEHGVWWGGEAYGMGRRAIGRTESADFRRFPLSQVILEPGPERLPDDVFYTNARTTVPGTDQQLLFPTIWHTGNDSTSIEVAASDDGSNWHFLPGPPVLDTASFGEWDGGCIFSRPNLIELPNGDLALPYTGNNVPHKYPRGQRKFGAGLAIWPKGRLVALEAAARGEFATAAILCPARKLRVNALAKRGGSILVEVADSNGVTIPGRTFDKARPILGDQASALVQWGDDEDLGVEKGRPIILRFRMDEAKLFGLAFED